MSVDICSGIMLKASLVSGHNLPYFICESSYTKIGAESNVFGCCGTKVGVKAARAGKKVEGEADGRNIKMCYCCMMN